jgi:hypothetical protein
MEHYRRRILINRLGIGLSMIAMAFGLAALMWILWTLFSKGFAALSWDFFSQDTPAPGSEGGGLRNAIVGSAMIVGFTTLVSTPIGILAGIYLAEYGDTSKFAATTRFVTDIMLSAPSIVVGLFVYALMVATLGGFYRLGRFGRAVPDRHSRRRADHREHAQTGAVQFARSRFRDRRAALAGVTESDPALGQGGRRDRRPAGHRAGHRRDSATAFYRAQQPVLQHRHVGADG